MPSSPNLSGILEGNTRVLARSISTVENEMPGHLELLEELPGGKTPVVGITGPPGAGKSTLVDQIIHHYASKGERVAALLVDPSSPFHQGALLGDRIRMRDTWNADQVFMRSCAARGALGGLTVAAWDVIHVLQSAPFDRIVVETVGVGQSEVDIARLADTTVVVLVPEAGDSIQHMKSGLMEVADVFAVNKSDREGAAKFASSLRKELHDRSADAAPAVHSIVATSGQGIQELMESLAQPHADKKQIKARLVANHIVQLIARYRTSDVDRNQVEQEVLAAMADGDLHPYRMAKKWAAEK